MALQVAIAMQGPMRHLPRVDLRHSVDKQAINIDMTPKFGGLPKSKKRKARKRK
jgi:hypothetical protein